jgi:hypothetical protein
MICRAAFVINLRNLKNSGRMIRMMPLNFSKSSTDRKDFGNFYKKHRRSSDVGNNRKKAKPIAS